MSLTITLMKNTTDGLGKILKKACGANLQAFSFESVSPEKKMCHSNYMLTIRLKVNEQASFETKVKS